ncbi:MAG: hemolysin activation protein [Bacteroidales bacterium]|nr:hemolysin activation protein [Bacteroidales bacterium]
MTKYPAKTDIAVLLLFFTRSDTFQQVFNAVRQARPSKLFLYQDGPRGEKDLEGIEACREIASDEHIDWECEVHRRYLDHNEGCDPSGFRSHRWAFSLSDKVIVLEDDVVPAQSFFPFCKEMLDRYEHDERISMIAGFNIDEVTKDCGNDSYFFTSAFSIWGWASWRRVAERWDPSYDFMHNSEQLHRLETVAKERNLRSDMLQMFRDHSQSGKEYFETIYWADMLLHNSLTIMPAYNQINNIGLMADSTHFSSDLRTTPHRIRKMFTMNRYELAFPLLHPDHVEENRDYLKRLYIINAWNHPWIKIQNSIEELFLNLRYGNFKHIWKSFRRRVRKMIGREKHV